MDNTRVFRMPFASVYPHYVQKAERKGRTKAERTWDLCLELLRDKTFWSFAAQRGGEFVAFLRAFKAMRAGFASGAFRYIAIVAEKR